MNTSPSSANPSARTWSGLFLDHLLKPLFIPCLALATALAAGALIIWATGADVGRAYLGLWQGALGSPRAVAETLVVATPYMLTGLGVALGFRAGLFNIGAEGQLYAGALASVFVGYALAGLPAWVHLPLALGAGLLAGGAYGALPGWLKARTGGHEVINTIMLNYLMLRLTDYLVKGPMLDTASSVPRTPMVAQAARLPVIFEGLRVHWGLALALAAVAGVYFLLWRTSLGFELRVCGSNPQAARFAGISVGRCYVAAMALGGALAGLAGAGEVLGLNHNLPAAFISGYGFDSIAIALLARSHPVAVVPAALLWGALCNGAGLMQVRAHISIDLINIIQALIIMFVAADHIIRWLYRVRRRGEDGLPPTRGWGA